jgi:hypothetical protein
MTDENTCTQFWQRPLKKIFSKDEKEYTEVDLSEIVCEVCATGKAEIF